jgi:hypothetical protein
MPTETETLTRCMQYVGSNTPVRMRRTSAKSGYVLSVLSVNGQAETLIARAEVDKNVTVIERKRITENVDPRVKGLLYHGMVHALTWKIDDGGTFEFAVQGDQLLVSNPQRVDSIVVYQLVQGKLKRVHL